jgi:uncharacterized membrane protein
MSLLSKVYISQFKPQELSLRRGVLVWSIVAVGIYLWLSLIVIAPLALSYNRKALGYFLYGIFSLACHQISERSFHLGLYPFAVCSRCLGLYAGFAIGTIIYPLVRSLKRIDAPNRLWLISALIPTGIDYALNLFGLWENTHLSRLLTGLLLGGVTAFYVIPGLIDLSQTKLKTFFASDSKV